MFDIPGKDYTVNYIHEGFDSTEFVRDLYMRIKESKGEEELYKYFSEVYEELFANLLLKKTYVSNSTRKMLEVLATPIYKKDKEEKGKIYEKIEGI